MTFDINELAFPDKMSYLQHIVAPRPICFASTINKKGEINLSPFSFFNLFSYTPSIVVFSPTRRVRNNTEKDTLLNVKEVPEVVINMVDYDMVQQQSLASCEYPGEINEFIKSGFTEEKATVVSPPMVKESKAKLECKVLEVKPLGENGGAGTLVICEVLKIHIDDSLLDENKKPDQRRFNQVARLGGNWYSKADQSSLFEVEKPNVQLGIGVDGLPESVRNSKILTGNNLGQLANVEAIPAINPAFDDAHLKQIIQYYSVSPEEMEKELHIYAKKLLEEGKPGEAWQVLLSAN